MKQIGRLALAVCAGVCVFSVARAGLLVSEKEVQREARVEWLSMKRHVPIDQNQRVQQYVACIANSLIAVIDDKHKAMDWEVIVFDDDSINASADPNGKIAVLSGILHVADTPDALAAVLGHEIAHATLNHVMDRAKKGARNDMLIMLGSAATGVQEDLIREGATIGVELPFERSQESQADLRGPAVHVEGGVRSARRDLSLEEHVGSDQRQPAARVPVEPPGRRDSTQRDHQRHHAGTDGIQQGAGSRKAAELHAALSGS